VTRRRPRLAFTAVALALAVGLATGLAPFASPAPDGLDRVARDEGFAHAARPHPAQAGSLAPGSAVPGVEDERVARALAGFAGTLAAFGACLVLAAVLRRRRGPGGRPR